MDTNETVTNETDILIIGTGLAGLAFALKTADTAKVILVAKEKAQNANSSWAQGGIAAVMSKEDSFQSHIDDTLTAGAGLCRLDSVRNIIEQAPARIQDLINWGVKFDLKNHDTSEELTNSEKIQTRPPAPQPSEIDLTREGGHSYRRILHFEDQTGLHIHKTLIDRVKAHPNIQMLEDTCAIDLIVNKQLNPLEMGPTRVVGAYLLNKSTGAVASILAQQTILATGGAGKVYLYTSNWSGATGDGIAMAYRAGARIANLEFMQFHPTCLYHPDARNFLISESLRGEGGELINDHGQAFMKKYHPLGSLAPRDIVARSIDAEMKKSGAPSVFLDMTSKSPEFLRTRFPAIDQKCKELGLDMSRDPIPVVPAAHYLCGGVLTDVAGQTDLPGLWALGETACTGLHGANRLASNSLLECLAMAHNAAEALSPQLKLSPSRLPNSTSSETGRPKYKPKPWIHPTDKDADELIVIHHMWDEIRRLMWNYVGIVRSTKRLLRAQSRLKNIVSEVKEYYSNFPMHSDILELRNIAIVAELTVDCALKRKESRGIHFSLDYPKSSDSQMHPKDTILLRGLK
jgi:L-aspartate oxidase